MKIYVESSEEQERLKKILYIMSSVGVLSTKEKRHPTSLFIEGDNFTTGLLPGSLVYIREFVPEITELLQADIQIVG